MEKKINIQKLAAFLYANNEIWESKYKKAISFKIAPKKFLGIVLTKEMKYFCTENYKPLIKEIRGFKEMERYPMLLVWKN